LLRIGRAALGLLGLTQVGCNWTEFDTFEEDAPIRVASAPGGYRKAEFGSVVTTFRTGDDGERSVLVASASRDSPVVFKRLWNGEKLTDSTFTRCKSKDDCKNGNGVGGALIPMAHWALGTPQEESGCIFAPGQPKAFVFCDSDTNANQSFELDVGDIQSSSQSAFFAGAGLPDAHPLGVVVLGAWSVSNRDSHVSNGRVFTQPDFQPAGEASDDDEVPVLEELLLTNPETGELFANEAEPGDLGAAIALSELSSGNLLIAVGQPSRTRVIVAMYDRRDGKVRTHACIDAPDGAEGFGERLALGDINDDGAPDLFVGTALAHSAERVWLYRGVGLGEAAEVGPCPGWGVPEVQVQCPGEKRGVSCDDSAFGASLAIGNVDGDRYQDLLVGAPKASVGGAKEAGGVWLFPGGPDSTREGGLDLDRATSLFAHEKSQARLGSSLAALHTKDRDEPVAGAPGEERVYTFMCSPLEEDVSKESLCLPK
jgi:hypothetical protein